MRLIISWQSLYVCIRPVWAEINESNCCMTATINPINAQHYGACMSLHMHFIWMDLDGLLPGDTVMKQPLKSWKTERLNVKHSGRCSCCGENRADSQQEFRPSTDKKSLWMWKARRPSLQRAEATAVTGKRRQLLFFLVLYLFLLS